MKIIAILSTLLFFSLNSYADHTPQVGAAMVVTAQKLIQEGQIVIDVRQEACGGYVSGAHLIFIEDFVAQPKETAEKILTIMGGAKGKFLAIYCRSGRRAQKAIDILATRGFTNLHNLGGVGDYDGAGVLVKCAAR